MAWKREHKAQSKDKILTAAASLFANKGFEGVSIDHIMQAAGLTRGAFYAHFKSKGDVYNQSVIHAAKTARKHMSELAGGNPLKAAQFYLTVGSALNEANHKNEHIELAGVDYCPVACLISDITQRDQTIQNTYTQVLKGFQSFYQEQGLSADQAVQVTTQLIGALALSKAVTDEHLKNTLLTNALNAATQLMSA